MNPSVIDLRDIDRTKLSVAGGKAANLGELFGIEGINVPGGFIISTEAFKRVVSETPSLTGSLDRLSHLKTNDRNGVGKISGDIRRLIEGITIPADITEAIATRLETRGEKQPYAIRSSATAEDLPTASFAGLQDTYLNITGKDAILTHITKCWASLFTERAISYRLHNGFDYRKVQIAVIVQQMVLAQAAGVLFTADPITSNRTILSIDAGFGLGEDLVSGLVDPDNYQVRNGAITDKRICSREQVLSDEQILRLGQTGRKIERHFGHPQDIEWCLAADNTFYIVQSRPITTLFPVPATKDAKNHVYVSVGHQQMMTDAMKPLGISFWQLTAARPMFTAGGRLFVDIAENLASPVSRKMLIDVLGKSDPLIKDALLTLTKDDFVPSGQDGPNTPMRDFETLQEYDPAIVDDLIKTSQSSIDQLKQNIRSKSGGELFDFILDDIRQLKKFLSDPRSFGVIMTAMNASSWVNGKMQEWLGEKNAADTVSQSAANNITSEMGLALLDVADVIRPHPEVIHFLTTVKDEDLSDRLPEFNGGLRSWDAIRAFLDKFGMRCVGEIDITRTRWSEKPSILVPMILSNIKNFGPNAGHRKFGQGRQEALKKEQELLDRLALLPEGKQKAEQTKKMIGLIRNFIGYREYPKYAIVSRYFIYKQALKAEAEVLVKDGILSEKEDIFYLSFEELHEVVRTRRLDGTIIGQRRNEHQLNEKLNPPRIITSDGEIVTGRYNRDDLPAGAFAGLAVSSGVVEGRARVILNMEDADLQKGDILVTRFTDPSWTPVFVSIKGLITEVGGLMTHGAVIAREYGLPAVVGVADATKLIKDGQKIRVNGTEGYIEIL